MIPVPRQMLVAVNFKEIPDENRRRLMEKELAFCRRNRDRLSKQANKTYVSIIDTTNQKLKSNSCDFKVLEEAYIDFCKTNNLETSIEKKEDKPLPQNSEETVTVSKEKYDALLKSNSQMKEVIDRTNLVLNEHPKLKNDFRDAKAETLQRKANIETKSIKEDKNEAHKMSENKTKPHKPKM